MLLDDGIRSHPKVIRAGAEAAWLWVAAIDYSRSQLLDGFVPTEAVPTLGVFHAKPMKLAGILCQVGLFEVADGGFRVHDFLKHNDSADTVKARRAQDAERKRLRKEAGFQPDSNRIPAGENYAHAGARERVGVGVGIGPGVGSGNGSGSGHGVVVAGEREGGLRVLGDDVWDAWRKAGARHGQDRIPISPSGPKWEEHMRLIATTVRHARELDEALDCWWSSPYVKLSRVVGAFASDLPEVLAHIAAGHPYAFRAPLPPPPMGVRGSKTQDNAAAVGAVIAKLRAAQEAS